MVIATLSVVDPASDDAVSENTAVVNVETIGATKVTLIVSVPESVTLGPEVCVQAKVTLPTRRRH